MPRPERSSPPAWFATCPSGFSPFLAEIALREGLGDAFSPDPSSLRFSTSRLPEALVSCCRGLHRILGEIPASTARGTELDHGRRLSDAARNFAADAMLRSAMANEAENAPGPWKRGKSRGQSSSGPRFILRAFGPDDPLPLDESARRALEQAISRATGGLPDSRHPQREYRLQGRADGAILLLARSVPARAEGPRPGELPPETANLLVELSRPGPEDVFLDPCAGYGSLPFARALRAPFRMIFAGDADPEKLQQIKEGLSLPGISKHRKTIFPKLLDARALSRFDSGFVSAWVSDPPWGHFEEGMGPRGTELLPFYHDMINEAVRVLAPGGRFVILTAREMGKEVIAEASSSALSPEKAYDVLISGRKATASLWIRQ